MTEVPFFCQVNSYSSFKAQVTLHQLQEALPTVLRWDSLPVPLYCLCICTWFIVLRTLGYYNLFPFLSPWLDRNLWEVRDLCLMFLSPLAEISAHSTSINIKYIDLLKKNSSFYIIHTYSRALEKWTMLAQLNVVSPLALPPYHTGKVDSGYLGIREIVSGLPVFLDIFPMPEAKLNERGAHNIFTHIILICTQKISWSFSPQLVWYI